MNLTLTFPERIHPKFLVASSLLLFTLQLLTGTTLLYAVLIFLFFLITGFTVNALGGLRTLSGFCVALLALKIVIFSQFFKVLFWQAGDSLLENPTRTAAVFITGIAGILAAGVVARPLKYREQILKPIVKPKALLAVSIVTYLVGTGTFLYIDLFGFDPTSGNIEVGGLIGFARQLAIVFPVSIISGTAYSLVSSGGRKSFGLMAALSAATYFLFGLLGSGKQGMYDPLLYYLLTCIAFQFTFRWKHIIVVAVCLVIAVKILFPYAEFARGITRTPTFAETIDRTLAVLREYEENPEVTGEIEQAVYESTSEGYRFLYYGRKVGLIDRLSLIKEGDELVRATELDGPSGWKTIVQGLRMLPPRFLYPDKPIYNTANFLAHRVGILSEKDFTTQVSFGFIAEAYSSFKWVGAFLIPFGLMLAFILVYKKLVGPITNNIWAVWLFGMLQHNFVEATIASMVLQVTQSALIIIGIYFFLAKTAVAASPLLSGLGVSQNLRREP
jgi:hypothetical protein